MANTKVILTVNTETIATDLSYKYKRSVRFSDNRGDKPGNGNKFDSKIDKGGKITWEGRPFSDPWDSKFASDSVEIIEVKHTYGAHLLVNDTYTGTKKVVGDVKSGSQCPDGMQWYSITFTVNGDASNPYTIDPKMHT